MGSRLTFDCISLSRHPRPQKTTCLKKVEATTKVLHNVQHVEEKCYYIYVYGHTHTCRVARPLSAHTLCMYPYVCNQYRYVRMYARKQKLIPLKGSQLQEFCHHSDSNSQAYSAAKSLRHTYIIHILKVKHIESRTRLQRTSPSFVTDEDPQVKNTLYVRMYTRTLQLALYILQQLHFPAVYILCCTQELTTLTVRWMIAHKFSDQLCNLAYRLHNFTYFQSYMQVKIKAYACTYCTNSNFNYTTFSYLLHKALCHYTH